MEEVNLETVHKDLEVLKIAVFEMKEQMRNCFLTAEEEKNLEEGFEELEKGEAISLEDLELERKSAQG